MSHYWHCFLFVKIWKNYLSVENCIIYWKEKTYKGEIYYDTRGVF